MDLDTIFNQIFKESIDILSVDVGNLLKDKLKVMYKDKETDTRTALNLSLIDNGELELICNKYAQMCKDKYTEKTGLELPYTLLYNYMQYVIQDYVNQIIAVFASACGCDIIGQEIKVASNINIKGTLLQND